ncbi:MAG: carbohydrate kinase family protein, partial [Armatimonadetes bacterium]|nr:carbohydrate kinase family protein [Armatimonadota bacterium]
MNKTLDISVIGLSCVDCIADGEFRRPNVQNPVGDIRISAGGLGNALVALSGLDLSVGVSTRVGDDMYGDYLLKQWRELGVNMSGVTVDSHRPTGFSFVLASGGERTPFYSAGTGSAFGPSDIPATFVEDSRCMIVFFA